MLRTRMSVDAAAVGTVFPAGFPRLGGRRLDGGSGTADWPELLPGRGQCPR